MYRRKYLDIKKQTNLKIAYTNKFPLEADKLVFPFHYRSLHFKNQEPICQARAFLKSERIPRIDAHTTRQRQITSGLLANAASCNLYPVRKPDAKVIDGANKGCHFVPCLDRLSDSRYDETHPNCRIPDRDIVLLKRPYKCITAEWDEQ